MLRKWLPVGNVYSNDNITFMSLNIDQHLPAYLKRQKGERHLAHLRRCCADAKLCKNKTTVPLLERACILLSVHEQIVATEKRIKKAKKKALKRKKINIAKEK